MLNKNIKCPYCKKNYSDPIEIETIEELGWCLRCEELLLTNDEEYDD